MKTVKLSSKGRLIIPKAIRDRHQWKAGMEFNITDRGDELVVKPTRVFPTTELEPPDATGVHRGRPLSLRKMEQAVMVEAGKQR